MENKQKKGKKIKHLQLLEACVMVASKLHRLVSSCYSCSLALTPYDLNVLNKFFLQMQFKEGKKV
jgi:hypothetical protein